MPDVAAPELVAIEGMSPRQRLAAAALRTGVRVMMRWAVSARLPFDEQRLRIARISRAIPAPPDAEHRAVVTGGVRGEMITARGTAPARGPTVLFLHGGGYCLDAFAAQRVVARHLAVHCGARVVAADYRLAPEHPFPAAIEDAVAVWRGLLADGALPEETVFAGDSAGGGLAVAAALRARELGLLQPAALVLLSPWVDLTPAGLDRPPRAEIVLTRGWLRQCARAYLGEAAADDPLASPVLADLGGLPPTLIQAGSDELLLPGAYRLRDALAEAGVSATLQVYPGCWHVFQVHAGMLPAADRALAEVEEFIRARIPAAVAAS